MQDIIINLGCISNAFPCIGFQGENEHRRIVFDAGEVYADYPDAVVTMVIKPPVGEVYPKIVTRDGNNVIWSVTAADVAYPDNGAYQLTFTNGTEIIKTYVGIYSVAASIIGNGQPPKPVEDWLKEAQAMLNAFAEMTAEANTLLPGSDATVELTEEDGHKVFLFGIPRGDTGNGIASCVLNADYTLTITFTDGNEYTTPSIRGAKGEPGKDGEDGFSPVVVVSEITGGHRVVITDAQGDNTFDVLNGEDGFAPVVVVTTITGGHRVTVTDASGSTSFDVMDGIDGTNGTSAYVWIRYSAAEPTQDSDMKTTPDAWMGIYSGSASSAPTHYTDYAWYNIKGATGEVSQAELDAVETELKSAFDDTVVYIVDGGNASWSPYSVSPVEYNIGSKNYIICVKGVNTTVTPSAIATAAVNAGLTVNNNVISGNSFAILFDPKEHEISVVKSPLTNANISKTTSSVIVFLAHYKSIRMGKVVDYMTEKRIETVETATTENAAGIALISNVVGNDIVPSYFESNLETKIPEIISNMNIAGQNGATFVFITDIHWETNYKNSPALVKRVLDKTSVKNVFCGGDIINEGEKAEMYAAFLDGINHFRFIPTNGFFPIARGNHDDNSNWQSSADITAHVFDNNTIYNLLYSQVSEEATRLGTNWDFYIDQPNTKTRFIFADTKRNGLTISKNDIISCLGSVQSGWHVIIIMHFTVKNATTLFDGADLLAHIVKAYNNRESGSYEGTQQTATYDFTNAAGYVDLIIGGHTHADYAMDADDVNNPSGIPIIATDTDSYRNHSGTEGTVNSQCFDVVTVDYTNKTVKCVRIGRGSDRNFSYGS